MRIPRHWRRRARHCWSAAAMRHAGAVSLARVSIEPVAKITSDYEPLGVAISPDGKRPTSRCASRPKWRLSTWPRTRSAARIPVGRWPRYVALSPDGARLAVNCNGDRAIAVVDTQLRQDAVSQRARRHQCRPHAGLGRRPVRLLSLDDLPPEPDQRAQHAARLGAGHADRAGAAWTRTPCARRSRSTRRAKRSAIRTVSR